MSPRAFTESEKQAVRKSLVAAATRFLSTTGIKKTSVAELAKAAGISKGAFYSFYQSKELLFWDALKHEEEGIKSAVIDAIRNAPDKRSGFVSAILRIYEDLSAKPWLLRLSTTDYDQLLRGVPKQRIDEHIEVDDAFAENIMQLFGGELAVRPEVLSAAFRMLFFGMLHRDVVGESWTDAAFKLMVESLADRLFGERT